MVHLYHSYESARIGLLYSLIGEAYPDASKSAGIGLLHSIMGYTYLNAFKSTGIWFTYTNVIKAPGYDYFIPL